MHGKQESTPRGGSGTDLPGRHTAAKEEFCGASIGSSLRYGSRGGRRHGRVGWALPRTDSLRSLAVTCGHETGTAWCPIHAVPRIAEVDAEAHVLREIGECQVEEVLGIGGTGDEGLERGIDELEHAGAQVAKVGHAAVVHERESPEGPRVAVLDSDLREAGGGRRGGGNRGGLALRVECILRQRTSPCDAARTWQKKHGDTVVAAIE